jgi:hypothetical protein
VYTLRRILSEPENLPFPAYYIRLYREKQTISIMYRKNEVIYDILYYIIQITFKRAALLTAKRGGAKNNRFLEAPIPPLPAFPKNTTIFPVS